MKEFFIKHPFISLIMVDTIVVGIENIVESISGAISNRGKEFKSTPLTAVSSGLAQGVEEWRNERNATNDGESKEEGGSEDSVRAIKVSDENSGNRIGFH